MFLFLIVKHAVFDKKKAFIAVNIKIQIHSTEVRTRLMDKLKASIPRVDLASLNGAGVESTTEGFIS